MVHIVTRAKSDVVGCADPPKKTGLRGRPRIYGVKHRLMTLFETKTVPYEEIVKSVVQHEYYHNFRFFSRNAIYRIIMSKSKGDTDDLLPPAA